MKIIREVFFFALAGIAGFLVDATVLYLLKSEFGLFAGRGVSFFSAVFVTWIINRSITFAHRKTDICAHREFLMYVAVMTVGGIVNYSLYVWLIFRYKIIFDNPIVGVAIGSLVGMLLNLFNSRFLIYKLKG